MKNKNRFDTFIFVLVAVTLCTTGAFAQDNFDLVINGGRVMDPETQFDSVTNVGVKDGRITFFNNALCRIFGYTAKEIRGRNYSEFMDAENALYAFTIFNRLYESGEIPSEIIWNIIRKDGQERIIYVGKAANLKKAASNTGRDLVGSVTRAQVREIAARYTGHARLFVGGVPMIAADMVSFVRSDLVVFGSAILGIMLLVLAYIFRRVRWVVIPLAVVQLTLLMTRAILHGSGLPLTIVSSMLRRARRSSVLASSRRIRTSGSSPSPYGRQPTSSASGRRSACVTA